MTENPEYQDPITREDIIRLGRRIMSLELTQLIIAKAIVQTPPGGPSEAGRMLSNRINMLRTGGIGEREKEIAKQLLNDIYAEPIQPSPEYPENL